MDWLQGKRVAITGVLVSMTKGDAIRVIEQHGGQIASSVTRNTSVLIVGQASWPLQKDGEPSKSLVLAQQLQQAGHAITIMPEDDFLSRLEPSGDGVRRMYTFSQLVDLVKIPRHRLRAWVQAGLIHATKNDFGIPFFDYRQVASAKTLCDLTAAGIGADRIRRNLQQLKSLFCDADQPLEQLAFIEKNGQMLVRLEEGLIEPSGQMLLDFEDHTSIVRLEPTSADQWFRLGCQNEEEGLLDDAADCYRRALSIGGPDAVVIFNLANVMYAQGMKEEAGERYRQAIEMDPSSGAAWNNLGIVLSELRRFDDAASALERAIALDYFDAHYNLADLLDSLGRSSAAREHWCAVARLDPNSEYGRHARRRLG